MPTDYASERTNPTFPQCGQSKLSLQFNGSQLLLTGGSKPYTYAAMSGKPGQYEAIPKGRYWIQPDQMWHCGALNQAAFWIKGFDCNSSGWGMYRITIHPYPGTDTGGRGGFFIHGGNHVGSAGCINLGLRVSDFVQDLKAEMQTDGSCYVPLTVT